MRCAACDETSSYLMPKEALPISCSKCDTIFPASTIQASFEANASQEESSIIAFVPLSLQNEFGDKFAKAAEMIRADSIVANNARAEASTVAMSAKEKADIWDFLVDSGFKPLAQMYGMDMPEMDELMGADDDMPPMDMGELDEPMGDVPELGEPMGGAEWEANQMVQAAMMHYKAQGNSVIEAITQFTKDYGDSYDPEMVMQMASNIYEIGLNDVKVGMTRNAGDLPSANVNQQQPNYVNVDSKPLGSGEESDQWRFSKPLRNFSAAE